MPHHISFKYAWAGLKYAFTSQPNFRIHSLIAIVVLVFALLLHLPYLEWLILLLTMALVLIAEMVNTALEAMTDLMQDQYHPQAKIAKDVAAGMVLLAAIAAVIVGLVIFIPYLSAISN